MGGVGVPLPTKVHRGVAPVVVRGWGCDSRVEAIEARSRLDQRAVYREVLVDNRLPWCVATTTSSNSRWPTSLGLDELSRVPSLELRHCPREGWNAPKVS